MEGMKLQFRRAQERDIPRIDELLEQVNLIHHNGRPDLFKIGRKYTNEQLIGILADDDRPVFAAVSAEDDFVLGYAFCVSQCHRNDNILTDVRTLYIDDLCVDERSRGERIGRALYDYVLRYAHEQGYYNVTLNVWTCNEPARKFYEACGMKPQKIGMEVIL